MSKSIVNLMETEITKEVEDVLITYADHPYQQAFSIPELRQELIAYVLSRISSSYVVVENDDRSMSEVCHLNLSPQEQQANQARIREGIQYIFDRHAESLTHQLPEEDESGRAPSHWFG